MAMVGITTLGVGACGGTTKFANRPKPPVPVNLTVYIDDARVSVSPTTVGAGPVVFLVTNQASQAESLVIAPAGGQPIASTGPINPQATAQVQVNFSTGGDYTVGTGASGTTEAAQAQPSSIQAAQIHIGPPRPGSGNTLMTP